MKIDQEKCIACLECIDFCPMGAIRESGDTVDIFQDECVECSVCLNSGVCPVEAHFMPEESGQYPRSIRAMFSDPAVPHPKMNQSGRGTEEMKTNDVTGRFRRGEYGLTIEFGRPGIGARLADIEKATRVLCPLEVEIEAANPTYFLIEDLNTGEMKKEVLQEKVLTAILEVKIKEDQLEDTLSALIPVLNEADTVVSLGLVTRFAPDGTLPVISRLEAMGVAVRPNAKINMGLGSPLVEE